MTLNEFREATKGFDGNLEIMIDSSSNPLWYFVTRSRDNDGAACLFLMDKSGIDLSAEIDAAVEALGIEEACLYLRKNGVTLDDILYHGNDEDLYEEARKYFKEEE